MTEIFNLKSQKKIRRNLRKLPVKSERLLWQKIRNRQLGYKFKRQFGIGKYIVDFYCPELKLIIEIDGATHSSDEEIKSDKIRQNYLESLNLLVKRYTNSDVRNNIDCVLGNILETCDKLKIK